MKNIIILIFIFSTSINLSGQQIESLDLMPEDLRIQNLSNEKYTIIEFWASWCSPCMETLKKIESYEEIYANDVEFLLINSHDDAEKSSEVLQNFNISSKNILNPNQKIIDFFNIHMIGNVMIMNKENSKFWLGSPSIINEKNLNTLIHENLVPTFELNKENSQFKTENYEVRFSLGSPAQKRSLTADDNFLKLTNIPLQAVLEILDKNLKITDLSQQKIHFNFEKIVHKNAENIASEIAKEIIKLFKAKLSENQVEINTDFLITHETF